MNVLFSLTLIGLLLFLWIALGLGTASFWTPLNISNLLRQGAMTAILAVGLAAMGACLSAVDAAIVRALDGGVHPFVIAFFRAAFGALHMARPGWL